MAQSYVPFHLLWLIPLILETARLLAALIRPNLIVN
jgi:hypothetical protein